MGADGRRFRGDQVERVVTERRRSRTYRAVGYTTAPVLKTSWATGPLPLPGAMLARPGCASEHPFVTDPAREAVSVEALEQELGRLPGDSEEVAEAG